MRKINKYILPGLLAAAVLMGNPGVNTYAAESVSIDEEAETEDREVTITDQASEDEGQIPENAEEIDKTETDKADGDSSDAEVNDDVDLQFTVDSLDEVQGSLYSDVADSGWKYDAISFVTENGIMNGVGNNKFNPNGTLTRGMVATVIYRMSGSPEYAYDYSFGDVAENKYYSIPSSWANHYNIIKGYSTTGNFGPNDNITRQDLVTMLYRFTECMGRDQSFWRSYTEYTDAYNVSSYAQNPMSWAISYGIIQGRSTTGELDPRGLATRAECAAILQRFVDSIGISDVYQAATISGGSSSGGSSSGGSSDSSGGSSSDSSGSSDSGSSDDSGDSEDDDSLMPIMGSSQTSVDQMVRYYNAYRTSYPDYYSGSDAPTIRDFCQIYYEEASAEGVRAEVAFCQAMKETGWLKFGGDVTIDQYNFAGLGTTGGGVTGCYFSSVREGVRAQIQHLKAYASTDSLNNDCVDPRFYLVSRGCAKYVQWLGKQENPYGAGWATAANYGYDIAKRVNFLLQK